MGFYKIGDESQILDCFDDNGKHNYCPTCGKKLTLIAIDTEENKFVCPDCEIPDEEKSLAN